MTKEIFIVYGETGVCEDRIDWTVCAYTKAEDAVTHIAFCNEHAEKLGKGFDAWHKLQEIPNPYDSDMSVDYTGTIYGYYSVPLYSKFKEL